jgi:glutamate racemase
VKPVGVFDSGVGGLSVLRSLVATLPGVPFVYVADQAHAPYGEKSRAAIELRARSIAQGLRTQFDIGALVVACNTATAHAVDAIRSEHPDLPIVGVEPALKPAATLSKSGCIGVLATRGTLGSERFERLRESVIAQSKRPLHVYAQACDGLADAIERGDASLIDALALRHVTSLFASNDSGLELDTVVLGCTHYPFVADVIRAHCPPGVNLIDTGVPVALRTQHVLGIEPTSQLQAASPPLLLSTGNPDFLQRAAERWLPAFQPARHWAC